MSNKKKRKSPCPSQVLKARSCSEGCAGTCSLKEGFIQLSCFQMSHFALKCWKWNLTIAGCFIFFPLCYDSSKTRAFLFQSTVAGSCCDSKGLLNALEQVSLAFCHTQHIVGTYLHIPNSFTCDTWTHDPFSPFSPFFLFVWCFTQSPVHSQPFQTSIHTPKHSPALFLSGCLCIYWWSMWKKIETFENFT